MESIQFFFMGKFFQQLDPIPLLLLAPFVGRDFDLRFRCRWFGFHFGLIKEIELVRTNLFR